MTKVEVVIDWGPLVQFFGEDYIDNITVSFWNTSTFVTTTDKWPVWNQTVNLQLYPMEASTSKDCRPYFDSNGLRYASTLCLVGGVLANIVGFAGWGISMGYAWSLVLMLQFITFLPLFKLYMPTCHTSYLKTLGIAHGYEF